LVGCFIKNSWMNSIRSRRFVYVNFLTFLIYPPDQRTVFPIWYHTYYLRQESYHLFLDKIHLNHIELHRCCRGGQSLPFPFSPLLECLLAATSLLETRLPTPTKEYCQLVTSQFCASLIGLIMVSA